MALSIVFHSINSPKNTPFSHSVLSVLIVPYWSFQNKNKQTNKKMCIFMRFSLSPDIILCGWRGVKHQLTNLQKRNTAPWVAETEIDVGNRLSFSFFLSFFFITHFYCTRFSEQEDLPLHPPPPLHFLPQFVWDSRRNRLNRSWSASRTKSHVIGQLSAPPKMFSLTIFHRVTRNDNVPFRCPSFNNDNSRRPHTTTGAWCCFIVCLSRRSGYVTGCWERVTWKWYIVLCSPFLIKFFFFFYAFRLLGLWFVGCREWSMVYMKNIGHFLITLPVCHPVRVSDFVRTIFP